MRGNAFQEKSLRELWEAILTVQTVPKFNPGLWMPAKLQRTGDGTYERVWYMELISPEVWNRLGTKIIPKLRSEIGLQIGVDFRVTLKSDIAQSIKSELRQILDDLGLTGKVVIEES